MVDYKARNREARETNLAAFLHSQGEIIHGRYPQYYWRYGDHIVSIKNNLWFDHYEQVGGTAINFVMKYYDVPFKEAVNLLLEEIHYNNYSGPVINHEFKLPPKNCNDNRVVTYLKEHRGIDEDVIYAFIKRGLIYESAVHHNVVFVGMNNRDYPLFAALRSTSKRKRFRMTQEGSNIDFAFNWRGNSNELYVFEAPIDLLSFICLNNKNGWQNKNYLAVCSVSGRPISRFVADNKNIDKVYLCFDNDSAGKRAEERIKEEYKDMNIEILTPKNKDWNEDLLFEREEGERQCQQAQSY